MTIEPCEDEFCEIAPSGNTTCGSIACPVCGRGGANLSVTQLLPAPASDGAIACGCGNSWVPTIAERGTTVVSTADSALCTCPEFCERDHDRD